MISLREIWKLFQFPAGGSLTLPYIRNRILLFKSCEQKDRGSGLPSRSVCLLLPEGLAVGTLICSGVHFVGTNQNVLQGAVVLILAVMGTLLNGTFDTLIGAIHWSFLL